jgi:hypothetical protein
LPLLSPWQWPLAPAVPVSICRWGRSIIPAEESRVRGPAATPDEAVQVRGLPTSPLEIATKGNSQIADRLLNEHCDVNAANNVGQTALMMAALFGRNDVVRLLIAHGANSALKDSAGNTAADLARQQRNSEMVTLLGGG